MSIRCQLITTKVVLFGAGASFGSGDDVYPYRTPLGRDLYAKLQTYFPTTWGDKVPSFLDRVFKKDFEKVMEQLVNSEFSTLVPLLMRNMSEYFVEFRPTRDSNLYIRFIKELKPILNDILFSTLNYDLLFEHAVKHNGLLVTRLQEIQDRIYFLKLHGSCDFIPPKGFSLYNNVFMGRGPMISMPLRDDATVEETIVFVIPKISLLL